jgi:hypothetical protein
MLIDRKSEVVSGTDDVPRLLQRVLNLARCEKGGSSCILAKGQSEEQQLTLRDRLTT